MAAAMPVTDNTIDLKFHGQAGQSFGAFVPRGMTLTLEGDGNDYVGKGLSGGTLVVYPAKNATFVAEDNIVIADTRFLNEADALTNGTFHSGQGENLIVRVDRLGVGPAGEHISETALDDYKFDWVIINNGSLEDLRTIVIDLYRTVEKEHSGLRLF